MSKKVIGYAFTYASRQVIDMPEGAEVLTVQVHTRAPTIWAIVDASADMVPRFFRMFNTGDDVKHPESMRYVGTCQRDVFMSEHLVYHLFEEVG